MRVAIVGAGPAGLYLAYLLKRSKLKVEVEVFEQNPADATFGFGLVFSERALEFLNDEDPDTLTAIRPALEHWNDSILIHKGREVRIDGMGYTGIGRLRLLQILQARAFSVGVEPKYLHTIDNLETCGDADLIVGADGVNSVVRRGYEDVFGTSVTYLTNRFAWFGTAKKFEALTHTFVETGLGHFNAHHHPHAPDMSTFVVEVDEPTFFRAGFDKMDADQAKAVCEQVFAETLDGHRLVSNKSIWRQFPKVWNKRWSIGNRVLVGDALAHRTFFHWLGHSVGDGGRHRAGKGAGAACRRFSCGARRLRRSAQAGRDQAGDGGQLQCRLVRAFRRAHDAHAHGLRYELHHSFRPGRLRAPAA